jgi:glycosyltransferase involved in cell wall biosynthesis
MAHGVPAVVSPIAAEGMHLVEEQTAMIAEDPARFADAVVRLWTSKALWERISANGRESVREHFSLESAARRIDELLEFLGLGEKAVAREDTDRPGSNMIASGSQSDSGARN